MVETKYGKYIITRAGKYTDEVDRTDVKGDPRPKKVVYLDDNVLKGAFYAEACWIYEKADKPGPPAHTHDFDEVMAFLGSNPDAPHDLCGEIDFWLEDEKHTLTESFFVFIPKGMKHSPFHLKRLDRPIFHFAVGPGRTHSLGKKQALPKH